MASEIYHRSVPAVLCPPTRCFHHLKKKNASTCDFPSFCNSKKISWNCGVLNHVAGAAQTRVPIVISSPRISPFLVVLKWELNLVSTSPNCQSGHKVLHGVQQRGQEKHWFVRFPACSHFVIPRVISEHGSEVKVCPLSGLFQQICHM